MTCSVCARATSDDDVAAYLIPSPCTTAQSSQMLTRALVRARQIGKTKTLNLPWSGPRAAETGPDREDVKTADVQYTSNVRNAGIEREPLRDYIREWKLLVARCSIVLLYVRTRTTCMYVRFGYHTCGPTNPRCWVGLALKTSPRSGG